MGKPTGFLEFERKSVPEQSPLERVHHWKEFKCHPPAGQIAEQAARCMECGTPFCHSGYLVAGMASGCPINNLIPEWNDLMYRGRTEEAFKRLRLTNNFPEFTGRVCPAPCEGSCVLSNIRPAVAIKSIECAISDESWEHGWMQPRPPRWRSGRQVAVIGSGPSGLAAAEQLNRSGHWVTVYERADRPGGLLMYGIPNMKLDKEKVVLRRTRLMEQEGIVFKTGVEVGKDISVADLRKQFDAVIFCTGATVPRDLPIEGRSLRGVHYAMEFLGANTKHILDTQQDGSLPLINAQGKNVVVIGGGDTGTDCVATSLRHGCKSVVQLEIMPQAPASRGASNPWPQWPKIHRTDYGQEEAAAVQGEDPRRYLVMSEKFIDDGNGALSGVQIVNISWEKDEQGRLYPKKDEASRRVIPAELVTIAMGFLGPDQLPITQLGLETDGRSNIKAEHGRYTTNIEGVFAAGDCRRGQSLVVWAINEGRGVARECDRYLMAAAGT